MTVTSLGAGIPVYFDFAVFSFQVPITGLAAKATSVKALIANRVRANIVASFW